MEKARAHIRIKGIVQGVFFRAYTRDKANALGLTGWVRNRPDGSVEVAVEGEKGDIDELIKWCHKGPPGAMVKDVTVEWEPPRNEFDTFKIIYY